MKRYVLHILVGCMARSHNAYCEADEIPAPLDRIWVECGTFGGEVAISSEFGLRSQYGEQIHVTLYAYPVVQVD